MAKEARELATYLNSIEAKDLAAEQWLIAHELEERGIPRIIKPDLRTETNQKFKIETLTIGGKTTEQLIRELEDDGFRISTYARKMMKSDKFTTREEPLEIEVARMKVADLALSGYPTTDQIYKRAQDLGLELCEAEVGPHYRLKYTDQPLGEWLSVAMQPIAARHGSLGVFSLGRDDDELWLNFSWALPGAEWGPGREFVFSLRKENLDS